MLANLARRAAIPALLLALPALSLSQSMQVGSTHQYASAQSGGLGPSQQTSEVGLVLGSWIDSSTVALGAMSAQLYDQDGQLTFHLAASTSEYIAAEGEDRFGGISGQLYYGIVPTGIFVDGSWSLDAETNQGVFNLTFYIGGQSPTAPILFVGSAKGRLSAPIASGQESAATRDVMGRWNYI